MQHLPVESLTASEYLPARDNPNLHMYLNEIRRYKFLGKEKSMTLAMRFVTYDDQDAARQLILINLGLVVTIALKYQKYWKSNFLDIIQEGNAGLVKAVERFDPSKGVFFSSYATYWIKANILKFLMDNSRLVKINTTETMRRIAFNYNKKKSQLEMQTGQADSDALAEILQINKDKIAEVTQRLSSTEISLATPLAGDSDWFLQDTIEYQGPSVADEVELKELRSKVQHILAKEKKRLTSRENLILYQRLLTDSPMTLKCIGSYMNISGERVRQIEDKLLSKLREAFCKEFAVDSSCVF